MSERMTWHDDERLYQPRIHSRRIRQLYEVAQLTSTPLTVLVDQALGEFLARCEVVSQCPDGVGICPPGRS
jgi:hypothetical protein